MTSKFKAVKMDIKLNPKIKIILLIALIFIALLLCVNTNNNPNPIIQRIFGPIHFGGGTLYYACLISVLIIYYSLKALNKEKAFRAIDTRFKRIVATILLLCIFSTGFQGAVKIYKGYCNDLNSIYCYRKAANVFTWTSENKSHVFCRLELQNCSKKAQSFYVKVRLPNEYKGVLETTLVSNTMLTLSPHERRKFNIPLSEGNTSSYFTCNKFEFSLFNHLKEVRFIPSDW